ncbi:hypothetical protein AC249_AIPGENE29170, partial [Exaiptasia diaphana]
CVAMVSGNDAMDGVLKRLRQWEERQDAISSRNRNGGRNSGRDRAPSGPGKPRSKTH